MTPLPITANPQNEVERSDEETALFLLDVLRALHAHGMPCHRLEAMAVALAQRLGKEAHFFTTPTALFVALGAPPLQRTFLVRADSGELDLGKLRVLDRIANEVADGKLNRKRGSEKIAEVLAQKGNPAPLMILGHAVLTSTAAILLGGGYAEAAVAAFIGLCVGLLDFAARYSEALGRLMFPLTALTASFASGIGTLFEANLDRGIATVAGLIIMVPGLTLTTAMIEVATGHLVSGTSRLAKAVVAFLLLGVGATLGNELASLIPNVSLGGEAVRLASSQVWLAAFICLPALGYVLRAHFTDLFRFGPAALAAFAVVQYAPENLGAPIVAGMGAMLLGLFGNFFARVQNRSAAIVIVPGLLLLVPGSLGFRSVTRFLAQDTLGAVSTAFDVAVLAIALVGGLLLATLAFPPRKAL